MPLLSPTAPDTLSVGFANLAALGEDLLHEIVARECSARAPPILDSPASGAVVQESADLFFKRCHTFFKGRLGYDAAQGSQVRSRSESLFLAIPSPKGAAAKSQGRQPLENGERGSQPQRGDRSVCRPFGAPDQFPFHGPGANAPGY